MTQYGIYVCDILHMKTFISRWVPHSATPFGALFALIFFKVRKSTQKVLQMVPDRAYSTDMTTSSTNSE